jgi:hypothetical protein
MLPPCLLAMTIATTSTRPLSTSKTCSPTAIYRLTSFAIRQPAIGAAHVGYLLSRKDTDDITEAADEIERLRADLDKSAKLAYSAVRAERAAIVALIDRHKKQRVEADSLWDEGYEAALDNIAAAIKARGET